MYLSFLTCVSRFPFLCLYVPYCPAVTVLKQTQCWCDSSATWSLCTPYINHQLPSEKHQPHKKVNRLVFFGVCLRLQQQLILGFEAGAEFLKPCWVLCMHKCDSQMKVWFIDYVDYSPGMTGGWQRTKPRIILTQYF